MDRGAFNSDFLAAALGLIGLPACACDRFGAILAVNPALTELLGHDACGSTLAQLFAPAAWAPAEAQLAALRAHEARWDSELQVGSLAISVQVCAKALPAQAGIAGATLVFSDLRSIQQDQAALRQTLLEQRAIFDNAAVGILSSRQRVIQHCNRRAADILGYAPGELEGQAGLAIYADEASYEALGEAASPLLAAGKSFHTEWQFMRKDGSLVWCRVYAHAIDPEHTEGGTIWILEDINDKRLAEDKLRRSVREIQALMDNAPLAIGFQRDGHIVRYNKHFARLFACPEEGARLDTRRLFPDALAYAELMAAAAPMLVSGQAYRAELEMCSQDGQRFWAHAYLYAINAQDAIWILEDRSAQRAADEATRRLVLEQKAILDNASVGILFTHNGLMRSFNPRVPEMFGYTHEEMVGLRALEVFTSASAYARFGELAGPLLGSGQLFELAEWEFRRKDGSQFWCRVRAKAIDDARSGNGTIWILEDVTASRETLMEVQAIMTNASIAILFTKNRLITRYNRGFADMFAYEGEEARNLPGRALYCSDEDYAEVSRLAFPLLSQAKPFHHEMPMLRKDRSIFWAQLIAYVVNPADPTQGTIWIIEDRTEQKRAEESLRNALLENQAILDSAVLGISVVEHGRNLRCNTKMEELFGYGPGEVRGLPVRALYPDEATWQAARAQTREDFAAGRVNMSEHQLVRKDGTRFWARLSGRPFDPSQPHGRSVWLVDDVTQRREAAEAVRRARDELELRVAERTAELAGANAQLQGEILERRQAEARVHHMAYHDSLTGLPNRALLADRLDRAMLAVQRSERKLAVMFLDLDRFKTINDSLGHHTGDRLLKEVASRLCRAVRASDTVARLGGDEFVVLVPGIRSGEESTMVAEKIIDALAAPFPLEERMLHITPSIGICVYPDDGEDVDTLMRHADAAMYHAKASGRNNFQFFTQRMNLVAAQHFELESSLRGALQRQEFTLYFQPIIDIRTRQLHAMEVLLRWQCPQRGLVTPDQFIPMLEDNGQIVAIGEWVIATACRQILAWQQAGLAVVPLSINLSARQFMHRGLIDSIRRALDETGIAPDMIEFEITETAVMQHGEQTLEILGQINGMGIPLSIDDFGTGYSSLAYLKRFPVHKVKIDRAFIKDLEHSAEDRAIVRAIIALADSMQLSVVAEGVETEAQFALLRGKGCQFAQGYLFAQPQPATQAAALLEQLS
ncbi:EAL domain-containing protein [Massilia sp. TS11]|uniref:bifunctional diguanylate cyclase/phosphodiesterase n=1 Tax=Massilia sp. TS11 TaxID=2908003 RepID=UPI001EDAEEF3|nr:EAL domain-containing protein [Massilia sp. TS11]MCG2586588.1 EAL domain-containing protein [Massilia sp. TS11]